MENYMDSYTLGIDVGGTKIQSGVIDSKGHVISTEKISTDADSGIKNVIERIYKCAGKAVIKSKIGMEKIKCAGVGIAGLTDSTKGILLQSPNLKSFSNVNLKKLLENRFKLPVHIENDVNCGALGEFYYGCGKKYSTGVALYIGTGIGGAIVIDKKLYKGSKGFAGELGHVVIEAKSEEVCSCGNKGCFEKLASRKNLADKLVTLSKANKSDIIKELTKNYRKELKSSLIYHAYMKKDPLTVSLLKEEARYIGIACANYINIFNPEVIILGGGLMESVGKEISSDIKSFAKKYAFKEGYKNVKIIVAEKSDKFTILGASIAALQHLFA
jgi:glucokinase